MWLNDHKVTDIAISAYRRALLSSRPNHVVIDHLFNNAKLDEVVKVLQQPQQWQSQKHTYSALYVGNGEWQKTSDKQRFVRRDVWQRNAIKANNLTATVNHNSAHDFLDYLRGHEFMAFLSGIFKVALTDLNVANPSINTNYFRLGAADFVRQHADDSPGREVCMLIYLNKAWNMHAGGELVFMGDGNNPISIAPCYNRCVLFDPFSKGSEHWVETLNAEYADNYRYNVTSWYWSE